MSKSTINDRKREHLTLAGQPTMQMSVTNGLDAVRFEPCALPELDFNEIDTRCRLFGKELKQPLIIASMSGGTKASRQLNQTLAAAAEQAGVALGLGSMRIAIEQPEQNATFQVRSIAPSVPILANIGGAQLIQPNGIKNALRCIDIAEADGLFVHLNPLQEILQSQGDTHWRGVLNAIAVLVKEAPVPVIVKEVGHGIGPGTAKKLLDIGVTHLDIAGAGGTSWAAIETERARIDNTVQIGEVFHNFGISLCESLKLLQQEGSLNQAATLIASGGIRSGLDVAKTIRLGATFASAASPILAAAQLGDDALAHLLEQWQQQLKITCFVTGCASLNELRQAPLIEQTPS
jgi:isopentenyl-diphosphate delta-isomerase